MTRDQLIIHRGRTAIIPVNLSYSVGNDLVTSQIRKTRNVTSDLIAEFEVRKTDDHNLLLMLDDSVTSLISESFGYMDIKRISNGEPFQVIEDPVEVVFVGVVTE